MKNKSISLYELKNKALGFMTMAAMTVRMKCDDIFTVGGTAASNVETKITAFADKAFPAVVVVSLVILLFTKDERKLSKEIKYIAIAIAAMLLLKNFTVIKDTITAVTGLSV